MRPSVQEPGESGITKAIQENYVPDASKVTGLKESPTGQKINPQQNLNVSRHEDMNLQPYEQKPLVAIATEGQTNQDREYAAESFPPKDMGSALGLGVSFNETRKNDYDARNPVQASTTDPRKGSVFDPRQAVDFPVPGGPPSVDNNRSGNRARTVSHESGALMLQNNNEGVSANTASPASIGGSSSRRTPGSSHGTVDVRLSNNSAKSTNILHPNSGNEPTALATALALEDADDHSSWEFVNHPPFSGNSATAAVPSSQQKQKLHQRRRSESSDLLPPQQQNQGQPEYIGSNIKSESQTSERPAALLSHSNLVRGNSAGHLGDSKQSYPRSVSLCRDDMILLEWYQKMSITISRIVTVADELILKSVFIPNLLLEISEVHIALHKNGHSDVESTVKCPVCIFENTRFDNSGGGGGAIQRRKSIGHSKAHIGEYSGFINSGFVYCHALDIVRECSQRLSGIRSTGVLSTSLRQTKSSPTMLQTPALSPAVIEKINKVGNIKIKSNETI